MATIQLTDPSLKRIIVRRAEQLFDIYMRQEHFREYDHAKSCLVWAAAVVEAAKASPALKGMQLQGGSASWRVVADDQDDGVSATHYSYVYTPPDDPFELGEVHYWAAVHPKHDPAGKGLIVDLTTKYVPDLATRMGMKVSCKPPKLVWAPPDEMPEHCDKYEPDMKAVVTGVRLIHQLLGVRV